MSHFGPVMNYQVLMYTFVLLFYKLHCLRKFVLQSFRIIKTTQWICLISYQENRLLVILKRSYCVKKLKWLKSRELVCLWPNSNQALLNYYKMQFKSISTTWKVIENSDVGREDGAQSLIFSQNYECQSSNKTTLSWERKYGYFLK